MYIYRFIYQVFSMWPFMYGISCTADDADNSTVVPCLGLIIRNPPTI